MIGVLDVGDVYVNFFGPAPTDAIDMENLTPESVSVCCYQK